MTSNDPRLLSLSSRDNVCAVASVIEAGERIQIHGRTVTTSQRLPVGFKVANRPIRPGEKILKYGIAIGTATAGIEAGQIVHLQNMKSDYLPTYMLDEENPFTHGNG